MKKLTAVAVLLAALPLAGCFTTVDETEWCVLTKFGKVKQERMTTGITWTPLTEATCFSITEQNFPEDGNVETMEAQTSDPVTVQGDVALVFSYNTGSVFQTFLDKRSDAAAKIEVLNAIREGYRTALAGWRVDEIFSSRRAALSDSVRFHIQRKVGDLAVINRVFVRNIKIPTAIEQARIESAKQAQELARVRQQYTIDSVNASALIVKATAEARQKELEARAYNANSRLLDLRIAEAMSRMCAGVQTCVIGGSVADTWRRLGGN